MARNYREQVFYLFYRFYMGTNFCSGCITGKLGDMVAIDTEVEADIRVLVSQ